MDERLAMVGQRLIEERNRLQLSQRALAQALGLSKNTIVNYEAGYTSPRADDLLVMARLGANIKFIMTGVRSEMPAGLTLDEEDLLRSYRDLDPPMRGVFTRVVAALANQPATH